MPKWTATANHFIIVLGIINTINVIILQYSSSSIYFNLLMLYFWESTAHIDNFQFLCIMKTSQYLSLEDKVHSIFQCKLNVWLHLQSFADFCMTEEEWCM